MDISGTFRSTGIEKTATWVGRLDFGETHFGNGKSRLQYPVEAEIEPNPGSTAMTGRVPLVTKNISLFHPKLIEYAIPPISTPPSPKSPQGLI